MPTYHVCASETIFQSCKVEANSPEEAIKKVKDGNDAFIWEVYDGENFEITEAVLDEDLDEDLGGEEGEQTWKNM